MLGKLDRQQLGPAGTAQDQEAGMTGTDTVGDTLHPVEGIGRTEDKPLLTPLFLSLTL